jgi:PAS domain-containing protein
VDVELRALPSRDDEFIAFARAAWAALPEPRTPEALQHALRVRYPAAIVNVQDELARHADQPEVWYAFRTAAIGTPTIDDSPTEPESVWALLDDDRRFLEVSPALAQIAELPAAEMLGHQVEEFSNPADPSIREDITRLWGEFRSGATLASTLRFNFADGRPREIAYRLEADAGGPGRHKLFVRVLGDQAG